MSKDTPESSERVVRLLTLDGAIWQVNAPWPNVPGTPGINATVRAINFLDEGDGEPAQYEVIAKPAKGSDYEKAKKTVRATIPWTIVTRAEAEWDAAELDAELADDDPPAKA